MKEVRYAGWLAIALAADFLVHSVTLLVMEPRMGFGRMTDYFDPALLVEALRSVSWLVGDVFHLLLGLLIPLFGYYWKQVRREGRLVPWLATLCGPLFLITGATGLTGYHLTFFLSQQVTKLDGALVALMVLRTSVLVAGIVAYGWLILFVCLSDWRGRLLPGWVKVAGLLLWLSTMATFLVPIPVPALFALWTFLVGFFLLSWPGEKEQPLSATDPE